MTDLSPAEQLRRRYQPDPARELLHDYRAGMAATDDPAERQDLYDAAAEVAVLAVPGDQEYQALLEQLHSLAFPETHRDQTGDAHRDLAMARGGEVADNLAAVFDALDAAGTDAERSELVAAAIASGAFVADHDATQALLASDPLLDARLDAEATAERAFDHEVTRDDEPGPVRAAFERWHAGETETMEVTNHA
jgi:hypothetical protein